MTPLIACIHYYWTPEANPYREVQWIVLVMLVVGGFAWRRVRPRPAGVAFGYVLGSSIVTMLFGGLTTCGDYESPREVCAALLEASIVLTACIYIEVVRAVRARRIVKATARYTA